MAPASDLAARLAIGRLVVDAIALLGRLIEAVIDALGVGLHESGEAAEQHADHFAGLDRRELEEDVIGVGDLDEEARAAARLALLVGARRPLQQDARGVGRDLRVSVRWTVPRSLT
jgi:hypothetical protein